MNNEKIPYKFPILQIKDKGDGSTHIYGTDSHDSLCVNDEGSLNYYNLQNGEGTGKHGDYEFIYEPDEGGYDGIQEVYSECENCSKKYDEMSKEELLWQCLLKDLQIRALLKVDVLNEINEI